MSDLIPRTEKKPAKVKDIGVINLCLAGYGVFSSKSNEVFLLPQGSKEIEEMLSFFKITLSQDGFAQLVDCSGSNEAVYSLADRFVRQYGSLALSFQERRGRILRVMGWTKNELDARGKTQTVLDVLSEYSKIQGIPFRTLEEIDDSRICLYACAPVQGDAMNGFDAFSCPECGECYSTHSPMLKGMQDTSWQKETLSQLTDVYTPGMRTISGLCEYLSISPQNTLKAMIYVGEIRGSKSPLVVFVRGDHDVSLPKLRYAAHIQFSMQNLRKATETEILEHLGEVSGYCGPINLPESVYTLADFGVEKVIDAVTGANRVGYHYTGCCYGRDFNSPLADLVQWSVALPCLKCGTLVEPRQLRVYAQIQLEQNSGGKVLAYRTKEKSESFPIGWSVDILLESFLLEKFEVRPL